MDPVVGNRPLFSKQNNRQVSEIFQNVTFTNFEPVAIKWLLVLFALAGSVRRNKKQWDRAKNTRDELTNLLCPVMARSEPFFLAKNKNNGK